MKGDLVVQQMTHSLEATKYDFVMGLEKREAFLDKLKLGWYFFIYVKGFSRFLYLTLTEHQYRNFVLFLDNFVQN